MFEVKAKPNKVERALLIGIYHHPNEEEETILLLKELEELVTTLEIGIVETLLVRTREVHKRFICGTGKAQEVAELCAAHEADCLIFDNALAPAQQRAWEEIAKITVVDREEIILDIFAQRAQTREATLQVELARMEYALPRMAKMWQHLDREGGGGSGGTGAAARGMGEQQIEIDRRLARQRIARVKKELTQVRKQRQTQRKEREKYQLPHAAIVGYTNAGKSSLINRLSGSAVMAKDMLFATLDTTTRRVDLENGQPLLLTDTVGFVRNLPHRLVEAFKATLEEAINADFLIHVVDASSKQCKQFIQTTNEVLHELGAKDKKILMVLNKIDLLTPEQLDQLSNDYPEAIPVSVTTGQGIDHLVEEFNHQLSDQLAVKEFAIPQTRGDLVNLLHSEAKVIDTRYEANLVVLKAALRADLAGMLKDFDIT